MRSVAARCTKKKMPVAPLQVRVCNVHSPEKRLRLPSEFGLNRYFASRCERTWKSWAVFITGVKDSATQQTHSWILDWWQMLAIRIFCLAQRMRQTNERSEEHTSELQQLMRI